MENKFNKFLTLLTILLFGFGQMWAKNTSVSYTFESDATKATMSTNDLFSAASNPTQSGDGTFGARNSHLGVTVTKNNKESAVTFTFTAKTAIELSGFTINSCANSDKIKSASISYYKGGSTPTNKNVTFAKNSLGDLVETFASAIEFAEDDVFTIIVNLKNTDSSNDRIWEVNTIMLTGSVVGELAIEVDGETTKAMVLGSETAIETSVDNASGSETYQWYKTISTDTECASGTTISGAESDSYIPDEGSTGTYYYYCVLTDGLNTAKTELVTVNVFAPLTGWVVFDGLADDAKRSSPVTYNTVSMTYETSSSSIVDVSSKTPTGTTRLYKKAIQLSKSTGGYLKFTIPTGYTATFTHAFAGTGNRTIVLASEKINSTSATGYIATLTSAVTSANIVHGEYTTPLAAGDYYICECNSGNWQIAEFVFTLAEAGVTPVCPDGISISGTTAYTAGETISLEAALTEGNGEITYTWYKGADLATAKSAGSIGTGASFIKASCVVGDAGNYFCVATKDDCSDEESSAYAITVAAPCTKPDAPENLSVESKTHNTANLVWDGGSAGVNGYKIALTSASGTGTFDWKDEATAIYEATGLTPSTAYTFKVKYKGGAGQCDFSDEVTKNFTTDAAPTPDYLLINQSTGDVNTAHFRINKTTSTKEGGYSVAGESFTKYIQLGGAPTTPVGADDHSKIISYDAKTNSVTVEAWIYNKASSDYKFYISVLEEGSKTPTINEYTATKNTGTKKSVTFTPAKNATIYVHVGNNSNVFVCQLGIYENGTDLKKGGEIGYSVRYDSCRLVGKSTFNLTMDGIVYNNASNTVKAWTTGYPMKLKATSDYIKFILTEMAKVSIKATGTYSVTTSSTYQSESALSNNQDVVLSAGTYYICPNGSNTTFASLAFLAPPATYAVTFNMHGHGDQVPQQNILDGGKVTEPATTSISGWDFGGWYKTYVADPESYSDEWDFANDVVHAATELHAQWTQVCEATAPGDISKGTLTSGTLTLNAAGSPAANNTWYWQTTESGVDKTNSGTSFGVTAAGTYYVRSYYSTSDCWSAAKSFTVTAEDLLTSYTVTYYDGASVIGTEDVVEGNSPTAYAAKQTKELHEFVAWYSNSDLAEEHKITNIATLVINDDTPVYGKWNTLYASSIDFIEVADDYVAQMAAKNYSLTCSDMTKVSYDDNTNLYDKGLKIKKNGSTLKFIATSGKVVEVTTGIISGATLAVNGGDPVDLTITTKSDASIKTRSYYNAGTQSFVLTTTTDSYCIFKKVAIHDPYQVSFDANGGDPVASQYATPSVTLPTPVNGTESFKGWYTAATEGTKIGNAGDTYTPTANITLHAQWESISSDNTLSDLQVDGATIAGFDPDVHIYNLVYDYGQQPYITSATATAEAAGATVAISNTPEHYVDATNDFWYVQANVTPASGTPIGYNQVRYTNRLKKGVSIIKATVSGGDQSAGFDAQGLYAGKGYAKLASNKKMDTNNYAGVKLKEGETFSAGDILFLVTTSPSTSVGKIEIYAEAAGTNLLWNTDKTDLTDGIVLPAAFDGLDEFYIVRKTSSGAQSWNGYVNYVEVQRYMDSFFETFSVAGANGVINESASPKTITIEVPYSTDITALTPTYKAWANGGATVAPTGAQDFSAGAVEYTVTSLYSESTTYQVTVNKAAVSHDASLTALSVAGYALTPAFDPAVLTYSIELPYGSVIGDLPAVSYTPATGATADKTDATTLPGATTIEVTAEDGSTNQTYTINFSVCRVPSVVIWDGSTMNTPATSPDATTGLAWTVAGFSVDNYSATCGSKAYTKCWKSGGAQGSSRYFQVNIPADYLAKFTIVVGTHEDGTERCAFIGTTATKTLDESSILTLYSSDRAHPVKGTSEVVLGAGTYYINPTASVDFYEVIVTLYPVDYSRTGLTVGKYGTTCLPSNVPAGAIFGAEVYKLLYWKYGTSYADCQMVEFEQVEAMNAGEPYLILPTDETFAVFYGDITVSDPQTMSNGFIGTFVEIAAAPDNELVGKYGIVNNMVQKLGENCHSAPNRAYIDLSQTPSQSDYESTHPMTSTHPKRLSLGHKSPQITTGLDAINVDAEGIQKVLVNGQLYIVRGGQIYTATGQLVK